MKSPEEVRRDLVAQWSAKAELDFDTAVHLLTAGGRFGEVVAFHSQQAVEKYVKALLVQFQISFPKTHDLGRLLDSLASHDAQLADALREVEVLTPFGVEGRYPGDFPELLAGEARDALELARRAGALIRTRLPA